MDEATVKLPPLVGGQAESWAALIELSPQLGEHWLLVGGQMVFLHEVERQATEIRPTDDVDVVVDLRADPAGLVRIHEALVSAGFSQDAPNSDGAAHRFRREAALIDVLAPDNVGRRAQLALGVGRTLEAPGTTQAFHRSSVVRVDLAGMSAHIRRPDLVGALIGKAAAVAKITSQSTANSLKHLRDFDSLARMLGPRDRIAADLSRAERKLLAGLADASDISDLGDAALRALICSDGS